MDLRLDFKAGRIDGDGMDSVGPFVITGRYDEESLDCRWVKTYLGRHSVDYAGPFDLGSIWGTWEIRRIFGHARGGFRIWPGARGEGASVETAAEEDAPVEDELAMPKPREL
jgi:hypothetical protein